MSPYQRSIRVAFYGTGSFARRTHIPNLLKLDGVEVVALCDVDPEALGAASTQFAIPHTYTDGHRMLESEDFDVLYSVVPAFARTDVEAAAAARGIHLFSEKPQALDMKVALAIDEAVRQSGVISTVGFRERYRPLFREARRLLADKEVVHVRFRLPDGTLVSTPDRRKGTWWSEFEKSGGPALDWGCHAMDYTRFMTGLNVASAQAFYCRRPAWDFPLSSSVHYQLSNGATMTSTFISTVAGGTSEEPWFTVYYEGGRLEMHRYDSLEVDGEVVYRGESFDPWFEQTRTFVEAVRTGDRSRLLNDYHDGLSSLAPVLAAWESARRGGERIDVQAFLEG